MEVNFLISKDGFYAIKALIESIENEEIGKTAITNSNDYTYRVIKQGENEFYISFKKLFEWNNYNYIPFILAWRVFFIPKNQLQEVLIWLILIE